MEGKTRKRVKRAVTLADVGREVGVSAMAVSAVINGTRTSSRISEDTRQKILEAAARMNYRPNMLARSLVSRRMNTIGVTMVSGRDQLNLYFLEVFDGIMNAANRHGQNITVFTPHSWSEVEKISNYCDGRIDGMILVGPMFDEEQGKRLALNVPFVSLHSNVPIPGVLDLQYEEEAGAYEMVKHLTDQGCRRILHLAGPIDRSGACKRIRGFRRALRDAGLPCTDDLLIETHYSMAEAQRLLKDWMSGHKSQPPPDAIFCVNDLIAVACLETLDELGLRVPEDVLVCGFDDTLVARATQLSSVRQPLCAMGENAVDLLLEEISHFMHGTERKERIPVVYPTELSIRRSTMPGKNKYWTEPQVEVK